MDYYDCIVIGAGISGLLGAKTYLDFDPSARVLIIDSAASPGGVWAKERIFPGLNIQSGSKAFSFPDLDIDTLEPPPLRNEAGFVTGESFHRYIVAYVQKHGLDKCMQLSTVVEQVDKQDDGWIIRTEKALFAKKLMVCNGYASNPHIPDIPRDNFELPTVHTKDLNKHFEKLSSLEHIAVYGGGKSAFDALHAFVTQGKKVTWILRADGRGPGWLLNPYLKPGVTADFLPMTRLFTLTQPALYHDVGYSWIRGLICRTRIGRALTRLIFIASHKRSISHLGEQNDRLRRVLPTVSPLWMYVPMGADNFPRSFYEYIRDGSITMVHDTITSLSGRSIYFDYSPSIEVDALVFATGWKQGISFFSPKLTYDLGLPSTTYTPDQTKHWHLLDAQAEKVVLEQNPFLKDPPAAAIPPSPTSRTQCRMWRFIVPPGLAASGDRSLVFLGQAPNTATAFVAAVTAAWAVAYLSGRLRVPADAEYQVALETAYVRKRYLGSNWDYLELNMDCLAYSTKLMQDMGLDPFMKGWRELFSAYYPSDVDDLLDKWMRKEGLTKNN